MKKTQSLLVVFVILLSLCACGNKTESATVDSSQETSTSAEETSTGATDATQATDTEETTVPTQEPATTPSEENNTKPTEMPIESTKPTEKPVEPNNPTETTKPVHTHAYSAATCTQPKKCACGATDGSALGHSYSNATCTDAKKCSRCGATEGGALGHSFTAQCTRCGNVNSSYAAIRDGKWRIKENSNGNITQWDIVFTQDGGLDCLLRWYKPIETVAQEYGETVETIRQQALDGQFAYYDIIDGKEYIGEPAVAMAQMSYSEEGDTLTMKFDWDMSTDQTVVVLKRTGFSEYTVANDNNHFSKNSKLVYID